MYQALYRKYRPVSFDDVISQPHITATLRNQIISGKTAHAYLFTGSRGTGKTTCARILAKALNCEHSVNGNPCGQCELCRDADNSALSDIIEIDAASNGSVNDARELREAAVYTPERCRYKVYIIDEVHMLSKDAFNALLKIIEEPPDHVKFIMATTELHKVLPTILSRCQRFDFMRIRTEDIAKRLLEIAAKENISLDGEAAELIAATADGGMRDALSILDRCIAFSENITTDVVSEAAGIAGRESLFALVEAIADKKPAEGLDVISGLYSRSKDMQRLCEELSGMFRNIMIAVSAPDRMGLIACLPSELDRIKSIAGRIGLERVLNILEELGRCTERMTRSLSKRSDMEMCVIRLCSDLPVQQTASVQSDSSGSEQQIRYLTAKVAQLEEQLRNGITPSQSGRQNTGGGRIPREQVVETGTVNKDEWVPVKGWNEILERFKVICPSVSGTLTASRGYFYKGFLLIETENNFFKSLLQVKENSQKLASVVREYTGQSFSGIKSRLVTGISAEQGEQQANLSPQERLSELLKKAEAGGVPTDEY